MKAGTTRACFGVRIGGYNDRIASFIGNKSGTARKLSPAGEARASPRLKKTVIDRRYNR